MQRTTLVYCTYCVYVQHSRKTFTHTQTQNERHTHTDERMNERPNVKNIERKWKSVYRVVDVTSRMRNNFCLCTRTSPNTTTTTTAISSSNRILDMLGVDGFMEFAASILYLFLYFVSVPLFFFLYSYSFFVPIARSACFFPPLPALLFSIYSGCVYILFTRFCSFLFYWKIGNSGKS